MDFIRHAKLSALQCAHTHTHTETDPRSPHSPLSLVLCMCSPAASEASSGTFQMQSDQCRLIVAGVSGEHELGVRAGHRQVRHRPHSMHKLPHNTRPSCHASPAPAPSRKLLGGHM